MHKTLLLIITLMLLPCSFGSTEDAASNTISHSFIVGDYGGSRVRIVSEAGEIEWEFRAPGVQDVWQLPNGNVLFSHTRGVKEVSRDNKTVWRYRAKKGTEVHSCQPLPNGNYLVAVSGPCVVLEITPDNDIVKTVKLTTNQDNPHAQMRQVRKLKNGGYIVGHNSDGVVREYDADGKVVRTIKVDGNPYCGLRLPNGNTLIGCGDGHKIVEVDPQDKIVWQIDENDLPGNPLRFIAGFHRLPNGNTVVCNWGGHGHVGEQPQLFEVTRDKKVVWQIFDYEKFSTISNVQILDVAGDATQGTLIK